MRWLDEKQQAEIVRDWSKVKYYEKRAAPGSTAVSSEEKRLDDSDRAASIGSGGRVGSSGEPRKSVTEQTMEGECSVAHYIEDFLEFECMHKLVLYVFSGLSFKFSSEK